MKKQPIYSIQEWLPFEKFLAQGIIKLKNNTYIKLLKIIPINYSLKSELEKEAILNSYKIFLKTCNFDLQILIQSNKEDLSNHISKIQNQNQMEQSQTLSHLAKEYINFIQTINNSKKTASKNFFILIKNSNENITKENSNYEEIAIEELNENYFKIKECLARCGNITIEIETQEEIKKIIKSFFYSNEIKNKEGGDSYF